MDSLKAERLHKALTFIGLLSVAVVISAWPLVRQYGTIAVGITAVVPSLLLLIEGDRLSRSVRSQFLYYAPFLIYSTFLVVFSILGLMPSSWTARRLLGEMPQQIAPYFFTGILSYFFASAHSRYGQLLSIRAVLVVVGSIYVASTASIIAFTRSIGLGVDSSTSPWYLYNLVNSDGFVLLALIWVIYSARFGTIWKLLLCVPLFGVCLGSSQNQLLVAAYVAVALTRWPGAVVTGLALFLTSVVIGGTIDPRAAYGVDHNFGVRAIFWSDAIQALRESSFIGVGFGTQSIRNNFSALGIDWRLYSNFGNPFQTGVHNSFVQSLFRGGVVLFALLVAWFVRLGAISTRRVRFDRNFSAVCFGGLLISVALNPSLESMNFVYLNSLFVGLILSSGALKLKP